MKKMLTLLLIHSLLFNINAQDFAWSLPFDSDGDDETSAICYSQSEVYVAGQYTGTIDCDPSSFVSELTVGSATNGYIASYNLQGELNQAFCFANGDGYYEVDNQTIHFEGGEVTINALEVGTSGCIYVAGYFEQKVDFNPNGESNILSSPYDEDEYSVQNDGFVAKYSPSGILLWIRQIGGDGSDDVNALQLDEDENVYFQGTFSGQIDFDRQGAGDIIAGESSNYGNNTYICKVSSDNTYYYTVTMKSLNGSSSGRIFTSSFVLDNKNDVMYLGGHFAYKAYLNPQSEDYTLNNARSGKYSGYIAKYSLDGTFMWATEAAKGEASTNVKIDALSIDPDGDIVAVGNMGEGSLIFEGGSTVSSSTISYAGFFASFSAQSGQNQWGWALVDGSDYAKFFPGDVKVSEDNEIFVSGRYLETLNITIDNSVIEQTVTPGSDGGIRKYDNILLKIDRNEVISYSTSGGGGSDNEYGIALGDNKELYICGQLAGSSASSIVGDVTQGEYMYQSEGGFLACFNNALARSNAKSILSVVAGNLDEESSAIKVSASTTVADLCHDLVVSNNATIEIWQGDSVLSLTSTARFTSDSYIKVVAENLTSKIYTIKIVPSELLSTSIGYLDKSGYVLGQIPHGTTVQVLIDALVYSEGANISLYSNGVALGDDDVISSGDELISVIYNDTSSYSLVLLLAGNSLLSSQQGRIVADTIYCGSGIDIWGFSKGLTVSLGAQISFYDGDVPILTLQGEYITADTKMQITSELGEGRSFYFKVIENAENYILSSEFGMLVTITNEIINVDASTTLQELLDGFTLSTGAVVTTVRISNGVKDTITAYDLSVDPDIYFDVESISGEIRTYSFYNIISSGLDYMYAETDLKVFYNSSQSKLIISADYLPSMNKVVVYSISGIKIYENEISNVWTNVNINLSLGSGVYILHMIDNQNMSVAKQFIVR